MHPEVVQAGPGTCPECGMFLEERKGTPDELEQVYGPTAAPMKDMGDMAHDSSTTGAANPASDADDYTCPMHPEVHSDKPGSCPKCGMFLEKTSGADAGQTTGAP